MLSQESINGGSLVIIAGPCQIESYDHCAKIAEFLVKQQQERHFHLIFKSSFDKANRTKGTSKRGPGIQEGLAILDKIKTQFQLPVTTDIHLPEQAAEAKECVDLLQIPAFLCRQTDLLLAAAATGLPINVKKGQFMHPSDMKFALEKIRSHGCDTAFLTERGSCFGYRDLIVDMRSLQLMKDLGAHVIFDATHSVQSMGGESGVSGGHRQFIPLLARAAVAAGVDGVFFECHDDPGNAPSDGKSMLPLEQVGSFLEQICALHELRKTFV